MQVIDTVAGFRTSKYTNPSGNCVDVALLEDGKVAVRDTKYSGYGVTLVFNDREWDAFIAGVKDGEFDRDRLAQPAAEPVHA